MAESVMRSSVIPLSVSSIPAGGASPVWNVLPFLMQHQSQTQWCWAAVATSVSLFYDASSVWTQCSMVNAELGQTTCCHDGDTLICNRPWFLNTALDRTANLNEPVLNGDLGFNEIRAEIDNSCPIGVRIGWINPNGSEQGGHFVIIDGYSDTEMLDIQDPWFGPSTIELSEFLNQYQTNGAWTHTFRTIA